MRLGVVIVAPSREGCYRPILAIVACIKAIALYADPVSENARTSPRADRQSSAGILHLSDGQEVVAKRGTQEMILNSAMTTSHSSGALVKAAYAQAVSTILVMAPAWTYPCCWER